MSLPADNAVRAYLRQSMVVQVATLSPKQRPFLTPLWFVVDGGIIYLTTGPQSRAGRNIAKHPEVALLFSGELGRRAERVLRLHGTATCHDQLPSWRVLLRVAAKYYLAPRGLLTELRHARQWPLRQLYYGQVQGGLGHIQVVTTESEFLPRL